MTALEPGFPIPEDIGMLNDYMLNYWGQCFVMEIKGQDGADYLPNTLRQSVGCNGTCETNVVNTLIS